MIENKTFKRKEYVHPHTEIPYEKTYGARAK